MTVGIVIVTWTCLPSSFTLFNFGTQKVVKNWQLFYVCYWPLGWACHWICHRVLHSAYNPVPDVADSCRTGVATNVIFGLALGYKSVIIPIFAIAVAIFVSFTFAAMYGIAVAALGMLSTIATGLANDVYGPTSDNSEGIAEMAGMSHVTELMLLMHQETPLLLLERDLPLDLLHLCPWPFLVLL